MNRMKIILTVFTTLMAMTSCGEKPVEEGKNVPLSVDKTELSFPADGGEKTFVVTSSENVLLVPGNGWITARKGTVSDEDYKTLVTVTAEKNTETVERSTRLAVTTDDEKVYVEIKQEAGERVIPGMDDLPDDPSVAVGLGWNLGNHMDAYNNGVSGETFWGNPKATQTLFNKLKEYGFTHVRIPVTWLGHIGEAPDYEIEAAWLDRVAEIVGYAGKAGLTAIVNMHHDGADSKYWLNIKSAAADPAVHQQIKDQLSAMWTQIAEKFRNEGDWLIFESMNEIHDGDWGWGSNRNDGGKQYQCYNEWQQVFVDAVRATGGENATRYLGIPGYCTNVDITIEHLVLPKDTVEGRLMVAVHCYDPSKYTLEATYSEWGHTAAAGKKDPNMDEDDIVAALAKMKKKFIDNGIPVYMGEMGCVNRKEAREQAFQQYYLEFFAKASRLFGIVPYIWDNGSKGTGDECHGFIDHATGEYSSEGGKGAIEAFLKGMFTEDEEYTLETVYDGAPL